jgi:hypothetical protein
VTRPIQGADIRDGRGRRDERALPPPAERDVDDGGGEPGEHEPLLHAMYLDHDGVQAR